MKEFFPASRFWPIAALDATRRRAALHGRSDRGSPPYTLASGRNARDTPPINIMAAQAVTGTGETLSSRHTRPLPEALLLWRPNTLETLHMSEFAIS
jgi:hypothetical protein